MSSKKKTSKQSRILSLKAKRKGSTSKDILKSTLHFEIGAFTRKDLARIWKVPKRGALRVTVKLPDTQVTQWITDPQDLLEIILKVTKQEIKIEKGLLALLP